MPAPAPTTDEFGSYLRNQRQHAGYTTAEAAQLIGVHQTTVSGWELGRGRLKFPKHAAKVAETYGIEERELQRLWWLEMGGYLSRHYGVAV